VTNSPSTQLQPPPPRIGWSLATRLTALYTGSAFVLIVASIGLLDWALIAMLDREDDQFLVDKGRVLLVILEEHPEDVREIVEEVKRESGSTRSGQFYLRVLDANGATLAETPGMSDELSAERFPPAVVLGVSPINAEEARSKSNRDFRVLSLKPAQTSTQAILPTVQVAMDRTSEEAFLTAYHWYMALVVTAALFGCGLVGIVIVRRALRPLRDIIATAQRIRPAHLDERLDTDGLPAELAAVASTLNSMLDRLENSFQRLERFSADIAHELRTPVNVLRGEVEVALGQPRSAESYREVLTSSLEEFGKLSQLIDALLFLARADSPHTQLARQPLDVAAELQIIRDFYEAMAHEEGVELTVRAAPGLIAQLDRTLFQRAISNLVSNAFAHTPRGGRITVTADRHANETLAIEVRDTGTGIEPEHLPHVFDRFYRADAARTSRGGSVGLGLPLVKSIVALHGGTCSISSEAGQGAVVRLVVPTRALQ